jgi:hypothetical protein
MAAADMGVTAEDIQGVLIAICPRGRHGTGGFGRRERPQGSRLAIAVAGFEPADDATGL